MTFHTGEKLSARKLNAAFASRVKEIKSDGTILVNKVGDRITLRMNPSMQGGPGLTYVEVTAENGDNWDVKRCRWRDAALETYGNTISDLPCWPDTDWPIVGDVVQLMVGSGGKKLIIPAAGVALFG